ncbi:MAG TPA: 2,3-bisphosphoglycerate-independent phosphoglycerate mutase [Candidatus Moranbacteria bacterium]|nr:2,3-bisphosphoglycerate-independent phosphoglycerate mutase [Candidatus Moranbacteria bacterium]
MAEKKINKKTSKPIMLIVLDGWGIGEGNRGNAITNTDLPTFKKLDEYYPEISLQASGISVGLPWGEPGNSEVGHMTLGAGKVIYQNMPRITMSIQDGEFFKNKVLLSAIEKAKKNKSSLHLMGLVGHGSVHSSLDHVYALLEMLRDQKAEKVFLHIFTDGRDSAPNSGIQTIKELRLRLEKYGIGKIATVSGRYFAMDRNNNWDRVEKAYNALVKSEGNKIEGAENIEKYLMDSYKKEIYDEYIEPAVIFENGTPVGEIADNDSIIFFNYREDRARQITKAFTVPGFSKFSAKKFKKLFFATMTQYEESLPVEVAFPPIKIDVCIGKVLSENKLNQLRIAETEKFAHVSYFFNGGNEDPFAGEDRIIVPSKDVSSFDKAPQMSALEITEKVLENVERDKYDFILINFANADIVGHTGNEKAAEKAVATIDKCLEKIIQAVLSKGGQLLITADHGNVEEMFDIHTGEKDTEHSANPVPLWYITPENFSKTPKKARKVEISGLLSDVAPTILDIMDIKKPAEMTGESLLSLLK